MSEKKQTFVVKDKKNDCGCGCMGIIAKKAKESKPGKEKSKK